MRSHKFLTHHHIQLKIHPFMDCEIRMLAKAAPAPAVHWKRRGGVPPPLQGAQRTPSHCLPDTKCQIQWRWQPTVIAPNRLATSSNRLSNRPGAASEVLSLLVHPCPAPQKASSRKRQILHTISNTASSTTLSTSDTGDAADDSCALAVDDAASCCVGFPEQKIILSHRKGLQR